MHKLSLLLICFLTFFFFLIQQKANIKEKKYQAIPIIIKKMKSATKIQKLLFNNPKLLKAQKSLQNHDIYQSIKTIDQLKLFMQRHCWAVWDFFLLIKGLQRKITNTNRFWTPCVDANAARFINEIVISQETDISNCGGEYISHFQLYMKAMNEIGADPKSVDNFVKKVAQLKESENSYNHIQKLVIGSQSPEYVKRFNLNTSGAIFNSVPFIAGHLLFGRQDPIPQMFIKLVKTLEQNNVDCPTMKFYLNRHIQLDGGEHGPKSIQFVEKISQKYDPEFKDVLSGALDAIEHRIMLWDGILAETKSSCCK